MWWGGVFPDAVRAKTRRGGPSPEHYLTLAHSHYTAAATLSAEADEEMSAMYAALAAHRDTIRLALWHWADDHLWRGRMTDDQLLRRLLRADLPPWHRGHGASLLA